MLNIDKTALIDLKEWIDRCKGHYVPALVISFVQGTNCTQIDQIAFGAYHNVKEAGEQFDVWKINGKELLVQKELVLLLRSDVLVKVTEGNKTRYEIKKRILPWRIISRMMGGVFVIRKDA